MQDDEISLKQFLEMPEQRSSKINLSQKRANTLIKKPMQNDLNRSKLSSAFYEHHMLNEEDKEEL